MSTKPIKEKVKKSKSNLCLIISSFSASSDMPQGTLESLLFMQRREVLSVPLVLHQVTSYCSSCSMEVLEQLSLLVSSLFWITVCLQSFFSAIRILVVLQASVNSQHSFVLPCLTSDQFGRHGSAKVLHTLNVTDHKKVGNCLMTEPTLCPSSSPFLVWQQSFSYCLFFFVSIFIGDVREYIWGRLPFEKIADF